MLTKSRTENALANRVKEYTLTVLPQRYMLLMLKQLPSWRKSRTLSELPSCVTP
jgi:hypothetical protein